MCWFVFVSKMCLCMLLHMFPLCMRCILDMVPYMCFCEFLSNDLFKSCFLYVLFVHKILYTIWLHMYLILFFVCCVCFNMSIQASLCMCLWSICFFVFCFVPVLCVFAHVCHMLSNINLQNIALSKNALSSFVHSLQLFTNDIIHVFEKHVS